MRPLPPPYDAIVAGHPAEIDLHGTTLLSNRLLTKDFAFSAEEREAFGLHGLLPDRVMTIEEQVALELERLHRKDDPLEQYIGLAALQDRNATLFYRVLAENLEELLPIVYTPTVGLACQEFSHVLRRTRGAWITPHDRERIPEILRHGPYDDVRLIVVTDNERILGLGDLGAGGMAIPIGKLALYTGACGIYPGLTLPVSLDVGTDNPDLLADPLYIGHRQPRLRGADYDALVDAFVEGVQSVWPGCLIQWEDFKQHNALRILDRYRDRLPSFNDDVQGTAAVVVAGVLSGLRHLDRPLAAQRILLVGAGAAGIGIGRLLRAAMLEAAISDADVARALALVDSRGLVHADRPDLDEMKRGLAVPAGSIAAEPGASLAETIDAYRPTILVGTTGVPGTFTEAAIRAMAAGCDRPIIMPLSNPTLIAEARPTDLMAWTDGRAIIATGSPFPPVAGREVGQANNVFVFPGLGLGAIVSEARRVSDAMVLVAARTLAEAVTTDRLAGGALYPSVSELRTVSRAIAVAVGREAIDSGLADPNDRLEADIDAAMWWPSYVPYHRPPPPART
ncbi:MAG: NAD-dependent malic enzyme [Chloroflexota bacterium]|nr:NAD-dependent malic enzyme [Chloroflexota bacterium]